MNSMPNTPPKFRTLTRSTGKSRSSRMNTMCRSRRLRLRQLRHNRGIVPSKQRGHTVVCKLWNQF